MVNVDFVAEALDYLSLQSTSIPKTFHLVHTQPVELKTIARWMSTYGYNVSEVPYKKWKTKLQEDSKNEKSSNALTPLLNYFSASFPKEYTLLCSNTTSALASASFQCPPVSEKLIHAYLAYYIQAGILHPPTVSTKK
jgi:hypothetical protein